MSQYIPQHNTAGTMKNGKKVGGQFSEKQFSTADDVSLGAPSGYFVSDRYVPRFNAPVEPEISLFDKGLNVVARSGNPPFDPVAARRRRDEEAGREPRFPLNRADWDASRAAEGSTKDEPMPKAPLISREARDHQAETLRNIALDNLQKAGEGAPKTRADAMREFNATREPHFGFQISPEDEATPYVKPEPREPHARGAWIGMMQESQRNKAVADRENRERREAAAAERQAARETAEREAAERARAQEVPAAKIGRFISRGLDKLKGV